jgi:2,4-dienoyl-CoA reductase (NADPH2)
MSRGKTMTTNKFEKLLEPGQIGSVKIKNRMIKSSAAARYWGEGENMVSDRIKFFYEAIARGGVGMIVMEAPILEPPAVSMPNFGFYRLDNDKDIKSISELTRIIHKYNCPTFVQFNNMANWQKVQPGFKPFPRDPPRGPSPVRVISEMDQNNEMPREITVAELNAITDKIACTAVNARKAGFDGAEINAACTHLFHAFLSPFWNKRTDAYGGSLENRTRFLIETLQAIKTRAGRDFPVSIIINGAEFGNLIDVDNSECLQLEDSKAIARLLQKAGADAIQVRSIWLARHDASFLTEHIYYPEPPIPPQYFPKEFYKGQRGAGANMLLAAAIKKEVTIPVMTVGRLDPEISEKMLEQDMVDFVCFTRRLIADPEFPNKIAAGKMDDIAPCTSCTTCKKMFGHRRCRINATIGTDESYVVAPAQRKKKVVVVGGGPAGMEAARVAAMRGHDVTLFERTRKLGGLLPIAATVKGLEIENLPALVNYLKVQMVKNGVDIRLGQKADVSLIERIKPDVVILATGGVPIMPEIPGINRHIVLKASDLHRQLKFFLKFVGPGQLRWLTNIWMPIGKKVVIIGGDIHGCELGEFLTKRGRQVTIVDTAENLGDGMIEHLKAQLFWWFRNKGVEMISGVKKYVAINDKGLVILTAEGYNRTIKADSIVPVIPMQPDTALLQTLRNKVPEVYSIGDCAEPKLIVDAISTGFKVGRTI